MTQRSADAPAQAPGIIVLGTPRSGTTLLRRLLNAHPAIACPGESNLLSACARFLQEEPIAEGVRIGVLTGLSFMGFDQAEVHRRLREFCIAFYQEYAAGQGKSRWAEKTAFDSFHVAEIERLFGDDAQFVCVQRHGLDVVCSLRDLCETNGGYLPELHDYVRRYPRPLVAFAHAWVDLTRAIADFAGRHPDNALLIRYEDLTADPEAVMQRVFGFLGETVPPDLIGEAMGRRDDVGLGDWKTYATSRIEQSSVGRWRDLSDWAAAEIGHIVNPTLEACGYDPVEIGEDIDEAAARRRYELGLMVNAMAAKKRS